MGNVKMANTKPKPRQGAKNYYLALMNTNQNSKSLYS